MEFFFLVKVFTENGYQGKVEEETLLCSNEKLLYTSFPIFFCGACHFQKRFFLFTCPVLKLGCGWSKKEEFFFSRIFFLLLLLCRYCYYYHIALSFFYSCAHFLKYFFSVCTKEARRFVSQQCSSDYLAVIKYSSSFHYIWRRFNKSCVYIFCLFFLLSCQYQKRKKREMREACTECHWHVAMHFLEKSFFLRVEQKKIMEGCNSLFFFSFFIFDITLSL